MAINKTFASNFYVVRVSFVDIQYMRLTNASSISYIILCRLVALLHGVTDISAYTV